MLECVANVSEGRDGDVIDALAAACGAALLDVHSDPDHHRSVLTLAGPPATVEDAARRLAEACVARVDVLRAVKTGHEGVHPRMGALDVVPFVALDATPGNPAVENTAVETARRFAGWLGETLEVPVFLYGGADPAGRSLPEVRRDAFVTRPPDFGPPAPHPSAGATAVGMRPVLVALNCDLSTSDPEVAKAVAGAVRERDGGLPGVRALGLFLPTRGCAQVSMNLVDLSATGVEAACTAVEEEARTRGAGVARVELVGLVPARELARCSEEFRARAALDASVTVEARLAARDTAL